MKSVNWHYPLFLIPLAALTACSDSDPATPSSATHDVEIQFAAKVNDADFTCGTTYNAVGTGGGNPFRIDDFRLFIHDAHIHNHETGELYHIELTQDDWQADETAKLDFENGSDGGCTGTTQTNTSLRGEVTLPSSIDTTSTEVCFNVGVPASQNHINPLNQPKALADTTTHWSWMAGYKYIKIDGVGNPGVSPVQGFNVHLGAQVCAAVDPNDMSTSQCSQPNTFEVCIDDFNLETDTIAVDAGKVLAGSDVSVNNGTAAGCMAFPNDADCVEVMARLGLGQQYGEYGNVGATSSHTTGQVMFSRVSN
jgi:uncharacterized repeat protein (TIGR04052 family)